MLVASTAPTMMEASQNAFTWCSLARLPFLSSQASLCLHVYISLSKWVCPQMVGSCFDLVNPLRGTILGAYTCSKSADATCHLAGNTCDIKNKISGFAWQRALG
jgi:hypothetical protein